MLRQTNDPQALSHSALKCLDRFQNRHSLNTQLARALHFHKEEEEKVVPVAQLLLPVAQCQLILLPCSQLLPRDPVLLAISGTYPQA